MFNILYLITIWALVIKIFIPFKDPASSTQYITQYFIIELVHVYDFCRQTLTQLKFYKLIVTFFRKYQHRKFSNKGAGTGHFHHSEAFYRMKMGPFSAEIWPKTSQNPLFWCQKSKGVPLQGMAPLIENLRYMETAFLVQVSILISI